MKRARTWRPAAVAVLGALSLALAACGGGSGEGVGGLSGILAGSGSSAQESAMEGWIAGFNDTYPDVVVSYDAVGSGGGREQFVSGAVTFAGSDAALDEGEAEAARERCFGDVVELPLYISPIAVIYNLPDVAVEHVRLSPATVAGMFSGEISRWTDPAVVADNPGVTLPDVAVTPVHRSDESGTTKNFTDYLEKASGGAWAYEASGDWPISGGQSGQGTQGVVDVVSAAEGAIGYADASRAGDLGTAALRVGEEYVPFSAEGAAAVVDVSPPSAGATDTQLTLDLDRTPSTPGSYPLVLVSYQIACLTYEDADDAANVQAFLTYIASEPGQARAAEPVVAGAAPISAELRAKAQAVIDRISAA